MKTIKGPAIFLAQFADDKPLFNRLSDISKWAAGLGYKGVQIPTWDARLFDLKRAAESRKYCDEILETLAAAGVQLTEQARVPRRNLYALVAEPGRPFGNI